MASDAAVWEQSLPGSGYQIVDVVVDGANVYAGSNGYVFRLSATDGSVAASNGLSGRGYNEVRLARATTVLIAGTNGYVIGLDPDTLATKWQTSLPSAGYQAVSVIVSGDTVYAGSNGYVYILDAATGAIKHKSSLSGMGYNEVRLTIGLGYLIVGTNGFVLALSLTDLSESWRRSLPSSGYQIVNTVCSSDSVYAGSNGYVYRLDSTGAVKAQNGLSGRGYNEVRMTLLGQYVIIGTNGYVLALTASNLNDFWTTSLPGSGYQIVSVLTDGVRVYAASNGYAYGLEARWGIVVSEEDLSGLRNHEVRIAWNGASLVMGTYGYVACCPLSLTNYTMQQQLQTNWCWAAVSSSTSKFYNVNSSWSQCRVVNTTLGLTACCTDGSSSACNKPWYLEQALTTTGNLDHMANGYQSVAAIGGQVGAVKPLGAHITWSGGGGHFVMVTGVHPTKTVDVKDPWYGSSTIAWSSFISSYQGSGSWDYSYFTKA